MNRARSTEIRPMRGVRFNSDAVGPIGPLLAPPYDVASVARTSARFSVAEIENVDLGVPGNQHEVAAARYRSWLETGILRRDDEPAIYLHEHQFPGAAGPLTRTAILAVVRLEDWVERVVVPHERTMAGPRAERLARLAATDANLSPLYLLYADSEGSIRQLLDTQRPGAAVPFTQDQIGGRHRLTAVAAPAVHDELARLFRERRLFVADGHHRYEAALAHRDLMRGRPGWQHDSPSEFVLTMLAAADDPGVIVHPTHRLLLGETDRQQALLAILARWFAIERVSEASPMDPHPAHICRVVMGCGHGVWDVRAHPDAMHRALLPRGRGPAFKSLPVAAVEGAIEAFRGATMSDRGSDPGIAYAIDPRQATDRALRGEVQAVFLLPRPRLAEVMAVGEEGDLLPAKSTWFDPKAPAGLVINDLRSW